MSGRYRKRFMRNLGWGFLILAVATLTFLVIWKVREWFSFSSDLDALERFHVENEILKTLAQLLGGVFLLVGFYLTWRRIGAAEKAAEANLRTAMAAEESQRTGRFSQAMVNLNSNNLTLQLSGIYSLEHIARDSWNNHWPIMEVLTSYVRGNLPWRQTKRIDLQKEQPQPNESFEDIKRQEKGEGINIGEGIDALRINFAPKPTDDIQAILGVLGRRRTTIGTKMDRVLDLSKTDLYGADFARSILNEANYQSLLFDTSRLCESNFSGADLRNSSFHLADLRGALFEGCNLSNTTFNGADVQGAIFIESRGLTQEGIKIAFNWVLAFYDEEFLLDLNLPRNHNDRLKNRDLSGYDLRDCVFQAPNMHQMKLEGANLQGVLLSSADLVWSDLNHSNLIKAILDGADLAGADLRKADLRGASLSETNL